MTDATAAAPWVIFPRGVNWFYERVAQDIGDELRSAGVDVELCAAADLMGRAIPSRAPAFIVSVKECIASLDAARDADSFVEQLKGFARRILVNYDCIYTDWFRAHLTVAQGLVTDIADVNMVPQSKAASVLGVPYHWIPECLTMRERSGMRAWSPDRPVPWAMAAHASPSRAAFLEALVQHLAPGGFAFIPPHRPYRSTNGTLTERGIHRLLSRTDIYLWSSHHEYPFHECLRVPHAIQNGAVPAKIDPLFYSRFAKVPWVFADIDALRARIDTDGLSGLYDDSREFLLRQGSFGGHFLRMLGVDAAVAAGTRAS